MARRWLYLTHRWIGIASCLLFAMWFVSGLVMIYVPYPSLSPAERLAGADPIDWKAVTVPPPVDHAHPPESLALEMRDGVPVWRVTELDGTRRTVAATEGARLAPVDAALAARVAGRFGHAPVAGVETVERDQWTVAGGFDRHRPLWKARLDNRARTELYVSSSTGGVVQSTTRSERFWNWLGSVPHWLYPTVLRQDGAAWRQVVLWVSGPCIAAALAGIWIGILRTRIGRRRFQHGRMTPYHGWMLWHHVAGMVGGLFLLAWIFSGWLSVDPGRLFRESETSDTAMRLYAGVPLPAIPLERLRPVAAGARMVQVTTEAGLPRLSIFRADGTRDVRDAATLAPAPQEEAAIERAAGPLVPAGRLVRAERLTAPDAYWYEVGGLPRLPVLRLRFDDPARTWLHVDPGTGEILERLDARGRAYRWLFDLLHKWDLNLLTLHRPLWDALLWLLSAVGLVTSVSGVWIGWRRLKRRS
ncbi:PepSY domain-containing protein [Sphingomonas sp. PR090111-T3T-6A]|uniref:PepSY domain-containing protein n=1 Tax=Sphingomonas sp. PR090111-T3T-6A TaxID=685778 RepID=UPI00036D2F5D|nr:PepSY domain-containing protein [Sphingomonas sp. PR090111-T3T-6A]